MTLRQGLRSSTDQDETPESSSVVLPIPRRTTDVSTKKVSMVSGEDEASSRARPTGGRGRVSESGGSEEEEKRRSLERGWRRKRRQDGGQQHRDRKASVLGFIGDHTPHRGRDQPHPHRGQDPAHRSRLQPAPPSGAGTRSIAPGPGPALHPLTTSFCPSDSHQWLRCAAGGGGRWRSDGGGAWCSSKPRWRSSSG